MSKDPSTQGAPKSATQPAPLPETAITIQWNEPNPHLPADSNAPVSELVKQLLPYEELNYHVLVTASYGAGKEGEQQPLQALFMAISTDSRDANSIFELQTCLTLIRHIALRQLQEMKAQPGIVIPKIRVGSISIQLQTQEIIALEVRRRLLFSGQVESCPQQPSQKSPVSSCI